MTMANAGQPTAAAPLNSSGSSQLNREEALAACLQLLSLSGEADLADSHCNQKNRIMTRSIREWFCPGLSLKHGKEDSATAPSSSSEHHHDRKQAEVHAVSLLARPLKNSNAGGPTVDDDGIGGGGFAAEQLQKNLYQSFATLVDSRLHAYSAVLARHALSLPEEASTIQEKLAEILLVGTRVKAEHVSTEFRMMTTTGEGSSITFQVGMELSIPSDRKNNSEAKKIVPVSFETSGTIEGT